MIPVNLWVVPKLLLVLWSQSVDTSSADKFYDEGLFEQAAAQYRLLLQKTPGVPDLWMRLGACEYQLARFGEAERSFRKALAQSPDMPPALIGLGTTLLALDRPREALPHLEKAVQLSPRDLMARRALGHAYQKENRFFDGERVLKALVKADPKDAESWYYLGALLYDNNYYQPALEALERSLSLQPENLQARIYRASSLVHLGRREQAEAAFQSLLANPSAANEPELLLGYAQFLFHTDQAQIALAEIDKALQTHPDSGKLQFWRARTLLKLTRLEEAARAAELSIKYAPELPNARNLLLKIYRAQGRMEEAMKQAAWLEEFEAKKTRRRP